MARCKRTRADCTEAYMLRVEMLPDPRAGKHRMQVATFDTIKGTKDAYLLADLNKGITTKPSRIKKEGPSMARGPD